MSLHGYSYALDSELSKIDITKELLDIMCKMQVYREYTLSIAYDLASSRHTTVRLFVFSARFTVCIKPIYNCINFVLCAFATQRRHNVFVLCPFIHPGIYPRKRRHSR